VTVLITVYFTIRLIESRPDNNYRKHF